MSNTPAQPLPDPNKNHQQILAQHVYDLHKDANKIAMQAWRSLRREEIAPDQLEVVIELLVRIEERLQYMKNCCWWIRKQFDNRAQAANEKEK